jgi:hypothetical protein
LKFELSGGKPLFEGDRSAIGGRRYTRGGHVMLHAIEFGADIPQSWELDHDPDRRVVLRVRDRHLTREIAALIRHFGTVPDVVVTVVPPPSAIPSPRDPRRHRGVIVIHGGPPGNGKTRLIARLIERAVAYDGEVFFPPRF